ncbi:hypothetical protein Bca4012_053225 [Brassica carinata]
MRDLLANDLDAAAILLKSKERFAVRAGSFSGNLDPWCSSFFSGVDGFDSIVWPAYVLVSHLSFGGRPAFGSGAHAFLFGVGPPASDSV